LGRATSSWGLALRRREGAAGLAPVDAGDADDGDHRVGVPVLVEALVCSRHCSGEPCTISSSIGFPATRSLFGRGVADWLEDGPAGALVARHVEGKMPAAQRESVLSLLGNLEDDESALISNVRCLAEGVDVPSIDAVAIIDPRRSRSEIIRAIGRALRRTARRERSQP
jgi:hypothetical protein